MKYTSKIFYIGFSFILLFFSCENPSDLSKQFACDNSANLSQLESVADFNKNFTVKLPKYWNTKLYYDNVQSEIFTADTIKSLSDTYIMDFTMVNSRIEISDDLQKKVHQKSMDNMMETADESFHTFKGNDAYAHLGIGTSRGLPFRVFQYYIKISDEKYMLIKTEFYGDKNFKNRFCEAIHLIDKITIN